MCWIAGSIGKFLKKPFWISFQREGAPGFADPSNGCAFDAQTSAKSNLIYERLGNLLKLSSYAEFSADRGKCLSVCSRKVGSDTLLILV